MRVVPGRGKKNGKKMHRRMEKIGKKRKKNGPQDEKKRKKRGKTHRRVVLEAVFAHGEQALDGVLHALVCVPFLQDAAETLENGQ